MTSHAAKRIIAIHILLSISQEVKDNQIIKFYQLIESNVRKIRFFFKNHAEKEAGRIVSDLFLFLIMLFMRSKQVVNTLSFNIFR